MKRNELLGALDEIAPVSLQESWDNCGMQIDLGKAQLKRLLVCLDVTDEIVDEAAEEHCDLIVSHHPLLFYGVKQISAGDPSGRRILRLIDHGISVYSAHTCFDKAPGGNNDFLLQRIGAGYEGSLSEGEPGGDLVIGSTGIFERPMKLWEAARQVSECLNHPFGFKVAGDPNRMVSRVGVCTGAGGEFYEAAAKCGCDLYISGEIKHHQVLGALELGLCLIDGGHYGTEWIFSENMAGQLRKKAEGCSDSIEILETKREKDPFRCAFYE